MDKYNHREIDQKWQEKWGKDGIYRTMEGGERPKYYVLDMFPYPSGEGLHVGHPKGYIATDILSRLKSMQGFNVLHPMGWDAFGLPAENYALKNKIHPRLAVDKNIATFKSQLKKIGFSYDWEREINTTDPEYYKWTQWMFIKMFEKGLAYESDEPIIWCPSCQTGLAMEDLEDGKCERCGSEIERKPMRQWVIKITDYADRLLADLEKLPGWEESIKEMQKNWIGRSEGAEIKFQIANNKEHLGDFTVFTTRPDTLFGCTYCVLAPEHQQITNYKLQITNWPEVEKYINQTKKKSDLERTDLNKDKTGVKLEGIMAINPASGEEVPIFIADYVLAGYGTGAVMAVPAHDERDFEFAKKYDLPIKIVVFSSENDKEMEKAFCDDGININSDFLNSLSTGEAKTKMIAWLEEKGKGKKKVNYKLKDWVFSRQRYWGEPIPMIHCGNCGTVPVPESQLPVRLPEVERYEPSGTGESPLAGIDEWVNTTCPLCGGKAKRETNTMPQWAGSSWYYLRYIDPKNQNAFVDKEKEKYWSPVDFYVGGAEHATRHLIYARFWHKFLFDIGAVSYEEPFTRLQHVGLIMAEDGRKMSKRWSNVINPDDIVAEYGADSLRVYEMFMGPFGQAAAWNTNGLAGARKFLDRITVLAAKAGGESSKELKSLLHKTIKKVGEDIADFKFNTAVSALMILVNKFAEDGSFDQKDFDNLLLLIAPFAPHLAEELWSLAGYGESIFKTAWPAYDPELIKDEEIDLVVQINGKLRDTIRVAADISEIEAKEAARASAKIAKWLEGKIIVKEVFIPGKLLNIVIK